MRLSQADKADLVNFLACALCSALSLVAENLNHDADQREP
jgi:hypothetical protein